MYIFMGAHALGMTLGLTSYLLGLILDTGEVFDDMCTLLAHAVIPVFWIRHSHKLQAVLY